MSTLATKTMAAKMKKSGKVKLPKKGKKGGFNKKAKLEDMGKM
jgi:hypothetical protein